MSGPTTAIANGKTGTPTGEIGSVIATSDSFDFAWDQTEIIPTGALPPIPSGSGGGGNSTIVGGNGNDAIYVGPRGQPHRRPARKRHHHGRRGRIDRTGTGRLNDVRRHSLVLAQCDHPEQPAIRRYRRLRRASICRRRTK